jgi:hypothetical protein
MCKDGMITAIFLAQMSLLMLALNDIVYLHTIVALRRKEEAPLIVKVNGENGILKRGSPAKSRSRGLATKKLSNDVSRSIDLKYGGMGSTFVGLYKGIISVSLAVASGALPIPLGFWLILNPLDPIGESTAMGVDDMIINRSVTPKIYTQEGGSFRIGYWGEGERLSARQVLCF